MFWRFGGYANISTLDSILDKPDVTLEELLDDSDLIQELKQNNSKLIEFLREEPILEQLLKYVIAPEADEAVRDGPHNTDKGSGGGFFEKSKAKSRSKSEDGRDFDKNEKRMKYAYVSCEILSADVWSIAESLLENINLLKTFWEYIKLPIPPDPLQASYFTKVNESLFERKTAEMVKFVMTLDNVVLSMMQHVDCPMLMDLLLKLISLEGKAEGQGIIDWLQAQDLIPILLSYLTSENSGATQTSAGDFLKAIITISANATGQDASVIGPNELTRELVSEECIQSLVGEMLKGGNPLTVGVGIIIEVIRKNNSDYDSEAHIGPEPKSSDPIYLGTLLGIFANHVSDFMELMLSPRHTIMTAKGSEVVDRKYIKVAWGDKIEPLGFDRFKTCELMAELLHCSNMGLLNEKGREAEVERRDAERARLKAEGKLASAHELPPAADFGTSVDSSGFHHAEAFSPLGASPENISRLEVQNSNDEDEFEKVVISEVIPENDVDDIFERSEFPHQYPQSRQTDDDDYADFMDEPLFSTMGTITEGEVFSPEAHTASAGSDKKILSTDIIGLTSQVGELDMTDDTIMTDTKSKAPVDDNGQTSVASKTSLHRLDNNHASNDKPAPLFASRASKQTPAEDENDIQIPDIDAVGNESTSDDIIQSSLADSTQTIQLDSQSQHEVPPTESANDGEAVVGDLLKMMFVEHHVVPTILDFFFRFPWNNFLHNVVYDVVQQVFNGSMDRGYNRNLAIDLFETGRITERIVEGQQRSDKAQQERKMRLGYMGHLTLIAEEVVKFSERQTGRYLCYTVYDKVMDPDWIYYVENTLADTRERDNAILGGVRPDVSVGPRQAVLNAVNAALGSGFSTTGSSALANAGLTGNGASGLNSADLANVGYAGYGGSNLSGSTLLSGFGSSDDEDDEDMEVEIGGNDGAGAMHGIQQDESEDQSTSQTTSADPNHAQQPIPPIPAPLAIPPSRARRQLAARLAERKRLAANTSNSTSAYAPSSFSSPNYTLATAAEAGSGSLPRLPNSSGGGFGQTETVGGARFVGGGGFAEGFSGFDSLDLDDEDEYDEDVDHGGAGQQFEEEMTGGAVDQLGDGRRRRLVGGGGGEATEGDDGGDEGEEYEEEEDDEDEEHGGGIGSPLRRQTTREAVERRPLDFGEGDDDDDDAGDAGGGGGGGGGREDDDANPAPSAQHSTTTTGMPWAGGSGSSSSSSASGSGSGSGNGSGSASTADQLHNQQRDQETLSRRWGVRPSSSLERVGDAAAPAYSSTGGLDANTTSTSTTTTTNTNTNTNTATTTTMRAVTVAAAAAHGRSRSEPQRAATAAAAAALVQQQQEEEDSDDDDDDDVGVTMGSKYLKRRESYGGK